MYGRALLSKRIGYFLLINLRHIRYIFVCISLIYSFILINYWVKHHLLSYKIHFSSHFTIRSITRTWSSLLRKRRTNDTSTFLIFRLPMRYSFIKIFNLSNLLQMANNYRVVKVEFICNNVSSSTRIGFYYRLQLVVVNFVWPPTIFFIPKALVSILKTFIIIIEPSLL